jgi:hypothetical protein
VPADAIARYLSSVSSKLGLDRERADEITKELAGHLEDATLEHQIRGLPMDEAQIRATEALGNPNAVSRKLKWVHGFGRYSSRPLLDACLGSLPFLLALAGILVGDSIAVVLWIAVIGVSIYALKEAIPAWTLTWLGFGGLIAWVAVFGLTFGAIKSVLDLSFALAYTSAFLMTASALVALTILIARKGVEVTLLFLLPLGILYTTVGYEDAAPSRRFFMTTVAAIFAFVFSFAYLMTRNRYPLAFGAAGFLFYNALYGDIIRSGVSPLNATGPALVMLWALIYCIPLLLVSSPAYFYLKRRNINS